MREAREDMHAVRQQGGGPPRAGYRCDTLFVAGDHRDTRPPRALARRAIPTSTPSPVESMNVTRFRSTISVRSLSASSNRHSRSRLTVEMSISPVVLRVPWS